MSNAENVKIFFKGVVDRESVKKRYKALLKIYHPDNMNGDNDLVLAINEEYVARMNLGEHFSVLSNSVFKFFHPFSFVSSNSLSILNFGYLFSLSNYTFFSSY